MQILMDITNTIVMDYISLYYYFICLSRDEIKPLLESSVAGLQLLFLVGQTKFKENNVEAEALFSQEVELYNDIIHSNTEDVYQKTASKIMLGYVWIRW